MNLKDYQRGRNDGLALALKIVQEGGREALEAEIKNRGVTGGELIMNYNESKETVLQLLPAEEVILQFAEECVELSREILVFDVEADGRLLSNGTEYKMLSKVREEAADVELVADVLLDKIYAAYDRRILGSMVGSILIVVKGLGLIHIRKVLHEVCHDLAKAALKLRRARSGENSTPITEEEAKEMLLCHISMIMALDTILFKNEEREQMESYRELIDTMAGRPVTIRTIDVGGDKLLSAEARNRNYFSSAEKEDNPALGLRAIRFTLANPNLFITQIRAILRAASGADVRIMLPMISSLQEIREAKRYIELAKTQLREEKLEFNEFVPVGIMIELPAAVICAEELLAEADFASLGTNDLIQYTLGVDRGNPSVAPLYDECHPAVLRLIRAAVKAAQKQNKPISICGEMGGRREMVPFFLGLGINELSMVPMQIPIVKEMIRSLKRSSCQRLTLKLVKSRDSGEVRKLLEQFTEKGVEENVG